MIMLHKDTSDENDDIEQKSVTRWMIEMNAPNVRIKKVRSVSKGRMKRVQVPHKYLYNKFPKDETIACYDRTQLEISRSLFLTIL